MDKRLVNAGFTERVTTDSGAARNDIVHTDGAIQLHHALEGLIQTCFSFKARFNETT